VLGLSLARDPTRPLRVLAVGAHADDIEIGCGGALLALIAARPVNVRWVVFSGSDVRRREAQASAQGFVAGAHEAEVGVHDFTDGFFPSERAALKEAMRAVAAARDPHVVFTHDEADLHQDHATLGALTRETFRDHLVLGYEIPKFDGGLGTPNLFVPVEASVKDRKIELIMRHFATQRQKHWFDEETLAGFMRLRGVESAVPTRYAEGFHCGKLLLGV
jgi:LmbE family N-acetylglucosaminyl deacetylase